jgi:hypothetical protein
MEYFTALENSTLNVVKTAEKKISPTNGAELGYSKRIVKNKISSLETCLNNHFQHNYV